MAIILEGMDGSGKSTLASKIALKTSHPGAPPKTKELEAQFFKEQQNNAGLPIVYDRVTCISQQVYRQRMFDPWYVKPLSKLIKTPHCVIVYCRPPDDVVLDLSKHNVQPHDTQEMLDLVKNNAALFLQSYDRLMSQIPHVKFDFTKDNLDEFLFEILPTQYHNKEWLSCLQKLKAMRIHS